MSTSVNYNVKDSWYRRNNGTWWNPLSGGRLATNTVIDGSYEYETKMQFDRASMISRQSTQYLVSAYLYLHRSDTYNEPVDTGYVKATNSSYGTIEGGASGTIKQSGWSSFNITNIMDSYLGAGGAYIGTYGTTHGSYMEFHTDGSSYPAYIKITWENKSVTAPTATSASPDPFISGNVTVSWSGETADHATINGYDIQYSTKLPGGSWTAWADLIHTESSPYAHAWSPVAGGQQIKYRVRTTTTDTGLVSGYGPESGVITYNSKPGSPTISFPVNGTTIYCTTPRIGFTFGTDYDGQNQIGMLSIGATDAVTNGANSSFYSRTGTFTGNTKLLAKWTTLAAGSYTIGYKQNDGIEDSDAGTRGFTIADLTLTNSTSTLVEKVHITELRTAINNVRAYYGLSAYTWSVLDYIRPRHITEMRTAITEIISFVNGYDNAGSTNDITSPTWDTITNVDLQDIKDIRDVLITL